MASQEGNISVLVANPHSMTSELMIGALRRRRRDGQQFAPPDFEGSGRSCNPRAQFTIRPRLTR